MSKCPFDARAISDFLELQNYRASLPWKAAYRQSNGGVSGEEISCTENWAMALTILFIVTVFALEHFLDERQCKSYQIDKFPKDLEETVSKIDSEKGETKDKDESSKDEDANGDATEKEDKSSEKEDGKDGKLNKDKPLLPQLKEKFAKAQDYGYDKLEFAMYQKVYSLFETIYFLLAGFLPYFWDWSVQLGYKFFGWNEINNEIQITLIFVAITSLLGEVMSLPWDLYSTFVVEEKHGFNKQTKGVFFGDKIKSLLLSFVIGGPFVVVLLKIIKWGGEHFYIYTWALTFFFGLFMMTIVPVVIMPLFNKYEPLEEGELKKSIYALAEKLNYPLTKLFVMDGSKRSSHSNAFMFGFGSNKRIVLFDTLMEQVHDDEILAILGHELGHWKLSHTLSNFVVTQVYMGAAFYCFSLCYNSAELYGAFGFDDVNRPVPTIIALMLFFQTLWAPVDKVLSFCVTYFTRVNEFAADRFATELGMGAKLQTGLCKISLENLGAMCPDPWYAMYHYSHPPLVERLSAIRDLEKKSK